MIIKVSLICWSTYGAGTSKAIFAYKSVLVTNVWELFSVVLDWQTGFIISWNNSKILWEKIIEMFEKKDIVKKMWENWKNFSDVELSWNDIIYKIYD